MNFSLLTYYFTIHFTFFNYRRSYFATFIQIVTLNCPKTHNTGTFTSLIMYLGHIQICLIYKFLENIIGIKLMHTGNTVKVSLLLMLSVYRDFLLLPFLEIFTLKEGIWRRLDTQNL